MVDQSEYRYFMGPQGPLRVPYKEEFAKDLYEIYTSDYFRPISQFEFDKERKRADLRKEGASAYLKAFGKGIASDLTFGGSEAAYAVSNPAEYFAYREEFPGTMIAGEVTSALATSIPAVMAASAATPLAGAGAAGAEIAEETAQFAARRAAEKTFLQRFGQASKFTGSGATAFIGESAQEIIRKQINDRVKSKLAQKITGGTAQVGTLAGEIATDVGIRGMVRGAAEQQALDPDSDWSDLWAAGVDTAAADIEAGLKFGGLLVGTAATAKGALELGRAARASKFYQEGVSPMVANVKAAILSKPEFRADSAQLIDALQRGDSDQLELMMRGNEVATQRANFESTIKSVKEKIRFNDTQRKLARLQVDQARGTREAAREQADVARAPFEERIGEARLEVDEAVLESEKQAAEVAQLREQRKTDVTAPLAEQSEVLREQKAELKAAGEQLKADQKQAAQVLEPRVAKLQEDIAAVNQSISGVKKDLPEDIAKEKRNLAQDVQTLQGQADQLELKLDDVNLKQTEIDAKRAELEQKKDDIATKKASLKNLEAQERGLSSKESSEQILNRRVAEIDNAIANNAPDEELQSMLAELERINSALKIAENTLTDQVINVAYQNSKNQSGAMLAIGSGKRAVRDQAREFESTFSGEIKSSLDDTYDVLSSDEFKELTAPPSVAALDGGKLVGEQSLAVRSQVQAFEQLPDLKGTKEIADSVMKSMETTLGGLKVFEDLAPKVRQARQILKDAETPEQFMVAYSFILDVRKDLSEFYSQSSNKKLRDNSIEKNTLNEVYNNVINRQFLRNEEIFGDVAVIQGISDSFNKVAVDSSMLNRGKYTKEGSSQLFDRVTSVNDEMNLAVNSMVQVASDLAAASPGATSAAATFASKLSLTVDPLARSLEDVQGKYLDATMALNDLNTALKQLIDPDSRFELQTLEELASREDMNLYGLSDVITTLRNNYDAFQTAKSEKGEIAGDIKFWRNQVKDLTIQKRNTSKDVSAATRELKKARKDAAKADAASASVVSSSSSTASATRAAIAGLEAGKIIDARNLQKLNAEKAALRRSANSDLNKAERAILDDIKARKGQSTSKINGLKDTAIKDIQELEVKRDALNKQLEEVLAEPVAGTGKQQQVVDNIKQDIAKTEQSITTLRGSLKSANEALEKSSNLNKAKKAEAKTKKSALRALEKEADAAAEKAVREYFDGLRESVAEPRKKLAEAEAQRLKLVGELEEAQKGLVGLATPDANALERLTQAKRALGPQTLMGEVFTGRALASAGLGATVGPMLGGATFAYLKTKANPMGAFRLQQKITSAGQTIAAKIDNTLNRLLSNQPLNPTKANQTYVLGRSGFAKMLKSYLVLQDSPAYVLTQEQAQEQREALRKLFNSPKQLTNLLERSGNSAPEEYAEAATKTTERVLSLANQIYPEEPPKPIFDKRPSDFTREELVTISNFNKMAQDPLNYVLYKLESNTLTAEDVNTLKALSPQIASKVMTQIISTIEESDESVPFGTQVALSTAFGLDLEAMENVAQLQNLLVAQASPTDQGQGTLNPEGVNRLRGTAQANMTQTQAVEAVGIG